MTRHTPLATGMSNNKPSNRPTNSTASRISTGADPASLL